MEKLMVYPMAALVGLTFLVCLINSKRKMSALKEKRIDLQYFEINSGSVPKEITVANRNYMNLLEAPLLFYVGAICFIIFGVVDLTALIISWTYILFRCLHTYIHLGKNDVNLRGAVFFFGWIIIILFWIWLLIKL